MATISIHDLCPVSSEPYQESQDLQVLEAFEAAQIEGGMGYGFTEFLNFGIMALQYGLLGFAMYNITLLATQFNSGNSVGLSGNLSGNPGGNSGGGGSGFSSTVTGGGGTESTNC